MATIRDIANETGVSTATVSNVLNGKDGAAGVDKTREILEVAERLHYTPNLLARSLKIKRTHNIGIITEDLTVHHTPEIVDGIEAACNECGYEIVLGNMRLFKRYGNDFAETYSHRKILDDTVSVLLAKQVEGLVYVGYHCRAIHYLPDFVDVPFVLSMCFHHQGRYPAVMYDDEKGGYDVTRALLERGHQRIGLICGPEISYASQRRLAGHRRALDEAGFVYDESLTFHGDWESHSGYDLAVPLLGKGVTAIFAFSDRMAAGLYRHCAENGIVIGKDLAVFGFDNHELYHSTPISSVALPLSAVGRKCAEFILPQFASRSTAGEVALIPCKLHVRNSLMHISADGLI